jgi:hypothetical protein
VDVVGNLKTNLEDPGKAVADEGDKVAQQLSRQRAGGNERLITLSLKLYD